MLCDKCKAGIPYLCSVSASQECSGTDSENIFGFAAPENKFVRFNENEKLFLSIRCSLFDMNAIT